MAKPTKKTACLKAGGTLTHDDMLRIFGEAPAAAPSKATTQDATTQKERLRMFGHGRPAARSKKAAAKPAQAKRT